MLAVKSTRPFLRPTLGNGRQFWLYTRAVRASRYLLCPVIVLGFWLAGCATQADLQQVQSERRAIRTQVANTDASIDSLDRKVQQLQGKLEEFGHNLTRLSKRESGTAPSLRKIEQRLSALEERLVVAEGQLRSARRSPEPGLDEPVGSIARAPTTPSLPFGIPSRTPPASISLPSTADTPECQDLYRGAVRLFQDQKYNPAIQEFRTFQRRCPESQMADDAQYWIGESHYVQNDYNRAILEFNDVLSYRRGDRVAAALLRQAQAFLAIGDKTDARLILQKLVSDHPSATQTVEAQTMLQTLGR